MKHLARLTASTWLISATVLVVLFGATLFIGIIVLIMGFSDNGMQHIYGNRASGNKLLSIKIGGVIVGDDDDIGGFAENQAVVSGYAVKQQLYDAANKPDIKGVVLEINSLGGTIYGSRAIADGVAYYREQTDKPVIAYVQGAATSGGYWIAASADEIIADYGSEVGAIGVIMGPFKYYNKALSDELGVLTQDGVQELNIVAGRSKDLGTPYRQLTGEEKAVLQKSVDNDYETFVSYVAEHRHIEKDFIKDKLGALPYDNTTAQEYKLIDGTGARESAYERLAAKSRLVGDFEVIRPTILAEVQNNYYLTTISSHFSEPKAEARGGDCQIAKHRLAYYGDPTGLCK